MLCRWQSCFDSVSCKIFFSSLMTRQTFYIILWNNNFHPMFSQFHDINSIGKTNVKSNIELNWRLYYTLYIYLLSIEHSVGLISVIIFGQWMFSCKLIFIVVPHSQWHITESECLLQLAIGFLPPRDPRYLSLCHKEPAKGKKCP